MAASRHAMDGGGQPMRHRILSLALLLVLHMPGSAGADAPAMPLLGGVRSWSAPAGTRLVFDFSVPVVPVAPDSGEARMLVVAVPSPGLIPSGGVPMALSVGDSAVDSVRVSIDPSGARFTVWMQAGTRFRVFTLPALEDKPFRVVVDVQRASVSAAEDQRLA